MPLQGIGDDDLRDRIVSGEAAVCTVWRTQRHDEGGDVIEISRYGLPRGERGLVTTTFGIASCLAKLRYVPSGARSATTKAEM